MEDFILREIDRIGELLRALLGKVGLLKASHDDKAAIATAKTELVVNLNMDIESLLTQDDFIGVLVQEHGFSNGNLEQFAELLADLAAASDEREERQRLAAAACAIYKYQDAHKAPASLNRYYILKELKNYNQ